jgi:hypothetical protein
VGAREAVNEEADTTAEGAEESFSEADVTDSSK